jgi:hypothetical protein
MGIGGNGRDGAGTGSVAGLDEGTFNGSVRKGTSGASATEFEAFEAVDQSAEKRSEPLEIMLTPHRA